jgi:hypothetical protein
VVSVKCHFGQEVLGRTNCILSFCCAVRGKVGKFVVLLGTCFLGFECAVRLGLGDAGDGKGKVCKSRAKPINVTPHPDSTLSTLFIYITLYT